MKRRKRIVSLLLAAMLLSVNVVPVCAAGEAEAAMPRWTSISMISSNFTVNSKNVATVSVSGQAHVGSGVDRTEVIVDLQRYEKKAWKTIKTFTADVDNRFAEVYDTYTISKGYSYQLYITVNVYKGSKLLESASDIYYYGPHN